VTVVALAGCDGAATAQTTPDEDVPTVVKTQSGVVAEAVIEPARWSEVHFEVGGDVIEVLVQEGDAVAADAPLARLDTDELHLSLRSAEQDVLSARAALDQLLKGATDKAIGRVDKETADQIAQAEVAVRAAQLQLARARAENPADQVDAARLRIVQLELQLAQARAQNPTPEVTVAQVALERAKIALDDAQNEYNKALDRPWEDQGIRDAWAKELEQKQLDYRNAQAQLDRALNGRNAHWVGLDALGAQIEEAEEGLAQAIAAQEAYAVSLELLAADVDAARLRLEALRTSDNPLRDEATEEAIAQAEVRLRQTEIAQDRLELQIEDAELRAPFAGTVTEVRIEVGDQVSPGQAGQAVAVSVDALPGEAFGGVVSEIALQAGDYRGDVVYAVTVALPEVNDLPLRWGMTALVKIEAE
jgi:multidrug efflux pump subunit AcrA (membrane-fusion protein)